MFEKFGEFDSYMEINMAAEGLKNEGDTKSIYVVAEENGIPKDFAEMYIAGDIDCLCDREMAAMGKIDVEAKEIKATEIVEDWVNYIKGCIGKDERMAAAVRRKGKSLKNCIAELLKWSFKNMYPVDKDILKAAGVTGQCKLGIPGSARVKQMIQKYYLGK